MTALILDCDGVLADTERDGHLVAFNAAFDQLGLGVAWSADHYAELLSIGGGKERLRTLFGDDSLSLPTDPTEQDDLVHRIHTLKTEVFVELVESGRIPARPGIRRVVEETLDAGWQLAVASTSAERSVRSVLDNAVGSQNAARFAGIFAGDEVTAKKPAPDIYLLACSRLATGPGTAVVIEDSVVGAAAATAAGLGHLVTVSGFTAVGSFPSAAAVVTSLGDTGEPAVCLAHDGIPAPGALVTLEDLDRASRAVPASFTSHVR